MTVFGTRFLFRSRTRFPLIVCAALALAACKEQAPAPAAPAAPLAQTAPVESAPATPAAPLAADATAAHNADAWLGKWTGPEGTFLKLEGGAGNYVVIIQDLDGTIRYPATSAPGRIQFERRGVVETVRASDGEATGMKWLADKKDCLTIKAGEGYCRD